MRFRWKFSISTGQVVYTVAVVLCDRLWCQWLGWWPRRRTEQTVHVNCYWWVTTPPCMRHQNVTNLKAWFFFSLYFQDLRRVSVLLTRPSTRQRSLEGMSAFLMFNLKALNSVKLTSSLMYLIAHVPKGFPSPCNLGSINLSTRCKVPSTNLKDVKWYHTVIVASEEGRLRVNSVQ